MASSLRRGAAPDRERDYAQDEDFAAQGQSDDLPSAYFACAFEDSPAVHADMTLLDQRLRPGAAFHQPDAMQETVDPHPVSA